MQSGGESNLLLLMMLQMMLLLLLLLLLLLHGQLLRHHHLVMLHLMLLRLLHECMIQRLWTVRLQVSGLLLLLQESVGFMLRGGSSGSFGRTPCALHGGGSLGSESGGGLLVAAIALS